LWVTSSVFVAVSVVLLLFLTQGLKHVRKVLYLLSPIPEPSAYILFLK
jgi:hypothetical protein